MDTKNIRLESDRRCSAEKLGKLLEDLPIEISSTSLLSARMGLGRIIYIRPEDDGKVQCVKIGDISVERPDSLVFTYNDQKYEIKGS